MSSLKKKIAEENKNIQISKYPSKEWAKKIVELGLYNQYKKQVDEIESK